MGSNHQVAELDLELDRARKESQEALSLREQLLSKHNALTFESTTRIKNEILSEQNALLLQLNDTYNLVSNSYSKCSQLEHEINSIKWKNALLSQLSVQLQPLLTVSYALQTTQDFERSSNTSLDHVHDTLKCVANALHVCRTHLNVYPILEDAAEHLKNYSVRLESMISASLGSFLDISYSKLEVHEGAASVIQSLNDAQHLKATIQKLSSAIISSKTLKRAILFAPVFFEASDLCVEWTLPDANIPDTILIAPPVEQWVLESSAQPQIPSSIRDISNVGARITHVLRLLCVKLLNSQASEILLAEMIDWIFHSILSDVSFLIGSSADDALIQWGVSQKVWWPLPKEYGRNDQNLTAARISSAIVAPNELVRRIESVVLTAGRLSIVCSTLIAAEADSRSLLESLGNAVSARELVKRIGAEFSSQLKLFSKRSSSAFGDCADALAADAKKSSRSTSSAGGWIERFAGNSSHASKRGVSNPTTDLLMLAPMGEAWKSSSARSTSWFGSCVVSRCAIDVVFAVEVARAMAAGVLRSARNTNKSNDSGSGATTSMTDTERTELCAQLMRAARDVLEGYFVDVSVQFGDEIEQFYRLQMLLYNDISMLAHVANSAGLSKTRVPPSLNKTLSVCSGSLRNTATEAFRNCERMVVSSVLDTSGLRSVLETGALANLDGSYTRRKVESCVSRCFENLEEVFSSSNELLNVELSAKLCDFVGAQVLIQLVEAIQRLVEIGSDVCDALQEILTAFVQKLDTQYEKNSDREVLNEVVMQHQFQLNELKQTELNESKIPKTYSYSRQKALHVANILQLRMIQIVEEFHRGTFHGFFDAHEIASFIQSIFEDSQLRTQMLEKVFDETRTTHERNPVKDSSQQSDQVKQHNLQESATRSGEQQDDEEWNW